MIAERTAASSGADAVSSKSVATLTAVDQMLSSASNALMVFALAQASSAAQFGVVALLVTGMSAWLGFNRGALGTPLLLTSGMARRHILAEASYGATWAVSTGILAAIVFVSAGAAFGEWSVGIAFAVCIPFMLAQDVLRFAALALGRPAIALASDGIWTAWMLLIFCSNAFLDLPLTAASTIYLWGLGAVVSALILTVALRVRPASARIVEWWRTYAHARLRFGSVYALNQIGAVLVALTATVMVGSVAAAGVRGAATLFGPIAMLVSALPLVFVPYARRTANGAVPQWRLLRTTSLITSTMTLVATAGLMFVPAGLGSMILGASWDEARLLLPYIGIECAAMCWIVAVYSFLQSEGASRTIFRLNLLQVGLQLTLCVAAALLMGTAQGIGISLAVSGCVSTLVGMVVVSRRIRAAADGGRDVGEEQGPPRESRESEVLVG